MAKQLTARISPIPAVPFTQHFVKCPGCNRFLFTQHGDIEAYVAALRRHESDCLALQSVKEFLGGRQ